MKMVLFYLECSVKSLADLLTYGQGKLHGEVMHDHAFQPLFTLGNSLCDFLFLHQIKKPFQNGDNN